MQPIETYLLIGDLHSCALVSQDGSIDWMCLPHFDSSSIFARILDKENGGHFSIDLDAYNTHASYVQDTAIVQRECSNEDHAFTVYDYMVPQESEQHPPHFLVRNFEGVSGAGTITIQFDPRGNYAKQCLRFHEKDNTLFVQLEEKNVWLHLPKHAQVTQKEPCGTEIQLTLQKGETASIVLEYSSLETPSVSDMPTQQEVTEYWHRWVAQGTFFDFCRDNLVRSAITLKLMQFYPTGALVAAPTTSLPEEVGGTRNWDYRYTWIRDATFTLYALSVLGYTEEAKRFFAFIDTITEESEARSGKGSEIDILLLYTIYGQQPQHEEHLEHMTGYKNSQPVRIGNNAAQQFQLDIYGSLIDAYYFMSKHGVPISQRGKETLRDLVGKIEKHWKEKEHGIWEVRSDTQHYTYGKVMAWVGVNRALRLGEEIGISAETQKKWEQLEKEIYDWIWKHCYDENRETFTQHPNTQAQDASALLFVPLQFLDRHKKQTKTIIQNTCTELSPDDLFVYRYRNPDGIEGNEGAFVLCSQWLIASLAAVEEGEKAHAIFAKLEEVLDHNGLFPEEIDPKTSAFLGNYPQAFSHMGYILSAYYVKRYGNVEIGAR